MNKLNSCNELPVMNEDGILCLSLAENVSIPGFDAIVALGGQAPLFGPADIEDAGLVRLGGQSPLI